jgi:ADP-ribose pyrophosphatase YjhB (NUDIX family)
MRKTKIVGFSVTPVVKRKFERLARQENKTKSEFFRRLIDGYTEGPKKKGKEVEEKDLAEILFSYWKLRSQMETKTIVIGLGIVVSKERRVLIGSRRVKDKWVKNLTWVFPGGRFSSLDFEAEIMAIIKKETGLIVRVKSLVAARVHPDSGFKALQIVALYFDCLPVGGKEKAGGDLKELRWVRGGDVFKYFTTSTCDEVTRFLFCLG